MANKYVNAEALAEQNQAIGWQSGFSEVVFKGMDLFVRKTGRGLKSRLRMMVPRQLKKHRILAGPLRGSWLVTSWQHYHTGILGTVEPGLITWIKKTALPGETWLDIGANYGYTALAMRRQVGSEGRVFAFEPKLSTCGCLSQTMLLNQLPQVTAVPMGLGSAETLEIIQLTTVGGMVAKNTKVGGTAVAESIESITVARLDWLWPQICGSRPNVDGVKIDVQGMELDVLQGMKGILRTFKPKLVVEVHNGVDRNDLLDLLEECGYSRRGKPIYTVPGEETEPQYFDNLSYAFTAR